MDIIIRAKPIKLVMIDEDWERYAVIINGRVFQLEFEVEDVIKEIIDNPSPHMEEGEQGGFYFMRFRHNSDRCWHFQFITSSNYDVFLKSILPSEEEE